MSMKSERRARELALQSDPDTVQWMCEAIERAEDLTAWCRGHDVAYSRMMAWIEADPARALAIDNAYRARAALAAGAVEAMSRRLLDPDAKTEHPWLAKRMLRDVDGNLTEHAAELDPRAARVAMVGFQWTAEKHHRERFGKVTEHKHTHSVQFEHLAAMRAFTGQRMPGLAADVPQSAGVPLAVLERMGAAPPGAARVDDVRASAPPPLDAAPNRSLIAGPGHLADRREPVTLDGEATRIAPRDDEASTINELDAFALARRLRLRPTLTRV